MATACGTFAVGEGSGNSFAVYSTDGTTATLVQKVQVFSKNFHGGVRVAVLGAADPSLALFVHGALNLRQSNP